MKDWFYRVFGKESSFSFKIIYCFIISILIILYIKYYGSGLFKDFTFNNYLSAMAVFVSLCFTIFSILDYIMVNIIAFLKYRNKYKFPHSVVIRQGVKFLYDPRKNKMIKVEDNVLNPALIMFDLMVRYDKRVRQDPYVRDMISKMADYCDEKIEVY